MSDGLQKRLNELADKILELAERLKKIDEELDKKTLSLEQKNQELQESKTKLQALQTERDDINALLGEKIDEINKSSLGNQEKSRKINELVINDYAKLKVACSNLTKTLNSWVETEQKINELLKIKEERSHEAVMSLEKTKKGLWITVFALLAVVFLLSLSLSLLLLSTKAKKRTKKKIALRVKPQTQNQTSQILSKTP